MLSARATEARSLARIAVPVTIADRLIDLGEFEQARKILHEAERTVKDIIKNADTPYYPVGRIAGVLARIDLPAALAILDDLERRGRKSQPRNINSILDQLNGTIADKLAAQCRLMRSECSPGCRSGCRRFSGSPRSASKWRPRT